MAAVKDIQIDEGDYTRIHNEILCALAKARLSGAEFRCVMFLLRKTYGWQKKEDKISLSQWGEGTGTQRGHVLETLNELIKKNIVYRRMDGGQIPVYGFNKYFEQWTDVEADSERGKRFEKTEVLPNKVLLPEQVTVTKTGNSTVTNIGNATVTNIGTHKRKKETVKESLPTPPVNQIMFGEIAQVCRLDPKLQATRIGKTGKELLAASYTPDDVTAFGSWWATNDWRGQRGEAPTLALLIENIYRSKNGNGNGHNIPINENGTIG